MAPRRHTLPVLTLPFNRVRTCTPQVNDDSTREDIKQRVDKTAGEMRAMGHQVQVTRRPNNKGFKAGNMNAGLEQLPAGFNPA
jgi:hypothetical protein